MKRRGSILLLDCGHARPLEASIQVYCESCSQGHKVEPTDDPFLHGYSCGLSAQLDVDQEALERLAQIWIRVSQKYLAHCQGCSCHACRTARKILRQSTQTPKQNQK